MRRAKWDKLLFDRRTKMAINRSNIEKDIRDLCDSHAINAIRDYMLVRNLIKTRVRERLKIACEKVHFCRFLQFGKEGRKGLSFVCGEKGVCVCVRVSE